jgi:ATP-dependent RNA helicase DeaD
MQDDNTNPVAFSDLGLPEAMLSILDSLGYENPTPIQAQTIPLLLNGQDVLGQAQTGTGKTAAFALPVLARLDMSKRHTQVLVLAPTRELAIQVAEAFQTYSAFLPGFQVLPIYGGAAYTSQLRQLKQGAQVVVGTPGRVMDHMRRGTLDVSQLKCLVLDEADEMLRMGFIDDVEWVLEQTPDDRQIALFSATMPSEIRRIARKHLNEPAEIAIANKTTTASTIRQRYWAVTGTNKLDALTRMLEVEDFDGMIIFVRTKNSTLELSDKLRARGFNAAPLNGDIVQAQREHTIAHLKSGALDIVVATDVAARGLDVERISHVINYDIPTDTEAYVHRIGRTGRAGRSGEAILFVAPREKRLLFAIEKATRQQIEHMELPSAQTINLKRIERFRKQIGYTLEKGNLEVFRDVIVQYQYESGLEIELIAAALAAITQGDAKFLLDENERVREQPLFDDGKRRSDRPERSERGDRDRGGDRGERDRQPKEVSPGMKRYRIDVGHSRQIKPGNIVGAIANEADISSKLIGNISIFNEYSTVDLPDDLSPTVLNILKKARVSGRPMNLVPDGERPEKTRDSGKPHHDKPFSKKPREDKPFGDKPRTDKPHSKKPAPASGDMDDQSSFIKSRPVKEVDGNREDYRPPVEKKRFTPTKTAKPHRKNTSHASSPRAYSEPAPVPAKKPKLTIKAKPRTFQP